MIKINYATRKTDEALTKKFQNILKIVLADNTKGYHQLPMRENLWSSCIEMSDKFRKNFDVLVVLGIGGSALGGRTIYEALCSKVDREVHFWDTIDPEFIDHELSKLKPSLNRVGWVLISKSGNTIETLTQADYVNQFYQKHNINWLNKVLVITEPRDNPLSLFATKHQLPTLEIPMDVGGRFSVLSPVGMFPAAFLGLNLHEFKSGALNALSASQSIVELAAQSQQSFSHNEWITVFWAYSSLLKSFGFWMQQLWAESLAKKHDRNNKSAPRASTPISCVGPTDQHSILQQFSEGAKDKLIVFLRCDTTESSGEIIQSSLFNNIFNMSGKKLGHLLLAEASATRQALVQDGVPTLTLEIPNISEKTLGFLFMYFELVVACLGESMDINTFDQPGVELGKKIAKDLLTKNQIL
jgi:glucose-6-phosphate isomerase